MKIAVYSCSLNEEKNAKNWSDCCEGADQKLILDTGSTDNTVQLLKDNGVQVCHANIRPWRFDDAFNMALNCLDDDVDVAVRLDLDERLTPYWRDHLEAVWTPETTRLHYRYIWNWTEQGLPDRAFYADRICGRHTHRWKNPTHETLIATVPEVFSTCHELLIEHYPDWSKGRPNDIPLLQLGASEDPFGDRIAHYLGREYYFKGDYQAAVQELRRHLQLPSARWLPERAASLRYMGKCYEHLSQPRLAYNSYVLATLEDVESREAYTDLARFLLEQQEWMAVVHFCRKALQIRPDSLTYITERYAREEGPFDLTAVALYHLGQKRSALDFAKQAVKLNPYDKRLQENLRMIEKECDD